PMENLTVNPSLLLGGSQMHYQANHSAGNAAGKINVVAKQALAIGDLRYLSLAQKQAAKATMQRIVQQHLPHSQASLYFTDTIPPMTPTAANQALLTKLNHLLPLIGEHALTPLPPKYRGAGDISYIADVVSAGLVGMGPLGE